MNAIRPMIFLTYRTWVNSVRRSLGSPRRTLGLMIFLALQVGVLYRIAGANGAGTTLAENLTKPFRFHLPQRTFEFIYVAEFGFLSAFVLFGCLGVAGVPARFKKADVDVLFSTPVSPKLLLGLSFLRGRGTAIRYAIFGLLTRTASQHQFGGHVDPTGAGEIGALADLVIALSLAFILNSLVLSVFLAHAQLYFGRDDERLQKVRGGVVWAALAVLLSAMGYAWYCVATKQSFENIRATLENPILRIAFFPATLATWVAQSEARGNPQLFWLGLLGMGSLLTVGTVLALGRADWLFEVSARAVSLAPSTDNPAGSLTMPEASAYRNSTAKVGKRHRLRMRARLLTARGLWALPWRTFVMSPSGHVIGWCLVFLLAVGVPLSARLGLKLEGGFSNVILQVPIWIFISSARTGGVSQLLRRGDQLKPLPFSSATLLFAEAAIQVVPFLAILTLANAINVAIQSYSWQIGSTAQLGVTSLFLMLQSLTALSSLIVPDLMDTTQRGLRSLVGIALLLLCNAPWILATVGTYFLLHWTIPWIAVPGATLNLLIAVFCYRQAGKLYEFYNPSE